MCLKATGKEAEPVRGGNEDVAASVAGIVLTKGQVW